VVTPVAGTTVAIVVSALLQIPPDTLLVRVEVPPTHKLVKPDIALGAVLTIKLVVAGAQPPAV
jgi:hypothetical protein